MGCPGIVIAGNKSGVGKTTLTLALTAALVRRGLKVQTYKVGPDFLDPTYLATASGRPCYNLDGWMSGESYVKALFSRTSRDADLAVVEGVMGLFDGAGSASPDGSTAEIARWLEIPVILVVDCHGMSRSLAALVKGYAGFEKGVDITGVIANKSGSERHGDLLAGSLKAAGCPPLLGAVTRSAMPVLESRHLGLVTADRGNLTPEMLESLADAFERHVPLERIMRSAKAAPPFLVSIPDPGKPSERVRLGVARDRAFHFYYQDFFDELERRGCSLEFFSPAADGHLPGNLHSLYLGGGYPEACAGELAANGPMLREIRSFACSGRPVYAECGGLMYLSRGIRTLDGAVHGMAAVLPAETRMLERRQALGYVEASLEQDSLWGDRGTVLRGHEFHYSALASDPAGKEGWSTAYSLRGAGHDSPRPEGFRNGNVLASYAHLHLAGRPDALDRFVDLCRKGPCPERKIS